MLKEITATPNDRLAAMRGVSFDYEKLLSMELVREHTKTDDVMSVSDAQLSLYRKAALQAAEKYTGLLFTGQRVIQEVVNYPGSFWEGNNYFFEHRARYAFAQPFAFLYGDRARAIEQITVTVGSNIARLTNHPGDFGQGCCNPCNARSNPMLQYVAGYACEDDIPAAIALGALKYIAHVIENAGDLVIATTPSGVPNSRGVGVMEAANPALASGALDIWRTVVDTAI